MRIAMLGTPWVPTPPPAYGGVERVVALLTDQLVDLGHEVTLYAAPGSVSKADVHPILKGGHFDKIGHVLHEVDHVTRALDVIENCSLLDSHRFDVIHDHNMAAAVAMAHHINIPMVHTMHNGHAGDRETLYRRACEHASLVAISDAQLHTAPQGMIISGVVPNPIDVCDWPLRQTKEGYALWIGSVQPMKGPHTAIQAAIKADVPLILAGPVQHGHEHFFHTEIEPYLNDKITYIGEAYGQKKKDLLACARVLLMPIEWNEPFGLVMVEALACGTPVIAFPEGAATEIVINNVNGYLVDTVAEMADAIQDQTFVGTIQALDCRESVRTRYDPRIVAESYLTIYQKAIR